jgi:hypothetical protein
MYLAGDDKAFLFTVVGVTRCALRLFSPSVGFAYSRLPPEKQSWTSAAIVVHSFYHQHDEFI